LKRFFRAKPLLICGSIAIILCFTFYAFISRSLPPPKVILKINAASMSGYSGWVAVCLTNFGPRTIWWSGNWNINYETEDGRIFQYEETVTQRAGSTSPSSGFVSQVLLQADEAGVKSWSVSTEYYHFRTAPLRVEFRDWILRSSRKSRLPAAFWKVMTWSADRLPKAEAETGVVSTDFIVEKTTPAQ